MADEEKKTDADKGKDAEGGEKKPNAMKALLVPILSSAVTAAVVGGLVVTLMKPSAAPSEPAEGKTEHGAESGGHGEGGGEAEGAHAAPEPEGHGSEHAVEAVADAHGGGEPSKVKHTGNYYQYDSFVVSIFDREKVHYLRLKVALEMSSEAVKEELDLKDPQIKDSMIFVLGDFTVRELLDNQAKLLVKEVLMKTLNKILGKGKIIDIYFTEFVVQ